MMRAKTFKRATKPTLLSSNDSASALPCASPLRKATSLPALVRIPSITARPSSRLVNVVVRAPSKTTPPKKVPTRNDNDVDWVSSETKDAIGRGRSVVPELAGTWLAGVICLSSNSGSGFANIMMCHII